MTRRPIPQWVSEFGTSYAVPAEVSNKLLDQSWHNDVAPSFTHADAPPDDDFDLRLWVEHPEPSMREYEGFARYAVTDHRDPDRQVAFIETDDLAAALAEMERQAARIKYARANFVVQWKDEDEVNGVAVGPAKLIRVRVEYVSENLTIIRPSQWREEDLGWMPKPEAIALAQTRGCIFEEV